MGLLCCVDELERRPSVVGGCMRDLPIGARSTHCRLSNRSELNGQEGTLVDFDKTSGRYSVHFHSFRRISLGKNVVSVRPKNILLPAGTIAEIVGISGEN